MLHDSEKGNGSNSRKPKTKEGEGTSELYASRDPLNNDKYTNQTNGVSEDSEENAYMPEAC